MSNGDTSQLGTMAEGKRTAGDETTGVETSTGRNMAGDVPEGMAGRHVSSGKTSAGIYFDNAATSFPKADGVAEAMADMIREGAFNVGRGGYAPSFDLLEKVLDTRDRIARLFSAPDDASVCFTSGITASLNQFIKGTLRPGDHVITSSVEHNSVMRPLHSMAQHGVEVSVAPCQRDGTLDPAEIGRLMRPNTRAVVITHASNVCGTILPVQAVGDLCRDRGVLLAVDTAQTAGVIPLDMEAMGIDFLAFSGHKALRGPQGVGGFVVRARLAEEMVPLVEGGTGSVSDQEEQPCFLPDRFESGTLPLPAIVGLRQALIALDDLGMETVRKRERALTVRFLEGLARIPKARVAGIAEADRADERTAVVSVDFSPFDNAQMAFGLERAASIMTRVGLHCAPRAHKTLGTFPQGAIRFSFGPVNTAREIDLCLDTIRTVLRRKD